MTLIAQYLRPVVGAAIIVVAFLFCEGLPKLMKAQIHSHIDKKMEFGDYNRDIAKGVAISAVRFALSSATVFGLFVAILVEAWKLGDTAPNAVIATCIIFLVVVAPICFIWGNARWVDLEEHEYERTTGLALRRVIIVLSLCLVCITAANAVGETPRSVEEHARDEAKLQGHHSDAHDAKTGVTAETSLPPASDEASRGQMSGKALDTHPKAPRG